MTRPARTRLGVMGGTFDPIHLGHLVCASEVAHRLRLDEVVFVPAGRPWQKRRVVTPGEHRYRMTLAGTAADPLFTVSRRELDRPGPTYTRDTLRELRAARPDADLFVILGADALAQVPTWRYADETFALAHLVGATRPGHAADASAFPPGAATLVEIPALDISSSDCRARVARHAPIRYLVPDGVAAYIAEHRLYRDAEAC